MYRDTLHHLSDSRTAFSVIQEADEEAESAKLREVSKRLYAQLQEAEKKHQEDKERLQVNTHIFRAYFYVHCESSQTIRTAFL